LGLKLEPPKVPKGSAKRSEANPDRSNAAQLQKTQVTKKSEERQTPAAKLHKSAKQITQSA
jgi:hypothetical protein